MLTPTIVTNNNELKEIYNLNQESLKQNISSEEREKEGFVTWLYSMDLLQEMHRLAPSIIVKDKNNVIGYALVTLKEAADFHPDLKTMVDNLEPLYFGGKPLSSYDYYCMGQVCIQKDYRGKGVFNMLYQKHKEMYSNKYNLLVTEISASNIRSQRAHENVGFETIHAYQDTLDNWKVVVWDWK